MLESKESNGIIVVNFHNTDRINALITEEVRKGLLGYYKAAGTKLVLDLQGIKFIDSSGFSVLLMAMKAANKSEGEFKICNIAEEVKELFQVLQLHNVFDVHDSLEECLESFN